MQTRWCQLSSSLLLLSEKASLRIPWVGDLLMDFAWLPINELEHLLVYPLVFQKVLQTLPDQPLHIVHTDS